MAEYAKGAMTGKADKSVFLSFITQVSPACDCYGHADAPIVNDIGICASTDPVAIDQACADLVNGARGPAGSALKEHERRQWTNLRTSTPQVDWPIQLEYAEQLRLGSPGVRAD